MRPSTKAQIQIGETIAVILVFVLLMTFGIYWMSSASGADAQQEAAIRDRLDLLETAKLVMNLPEIQCSQAGVPDTSCMDVYRISALRTQLADEDSVTSQLYKNRFVTGDRGSYELIVRTISPGEQREIKVFDFHQETPDASQRSLAIPVVLLDPVTDTRQFSVAILTQEVTQ